MRLASKLCLLNKADWHFWKPFLMDQPHHHNPSSWLHKAQRDLGAVISHSFSSAEILAAFPFPECQHPFCYCIKQHIGWCLFTFIPGRRKNCVPNTIISCAYRAQNGPYMRTWKKLAKEPSLHRHWCAKGTVLPTTFHVFAQISSSPNFWGAL